MIKRGNNKRSLKVRTFHSYGPVNAKRHFCVERKDLIALCTKQLLGNINDDGHYFTIWGPRQTGKTWLFRQCINAIKQQHSDQFIIGELSMQGLVFNEKDDPTETFFNSIPDVLQSAFSNQTGSMKYKFVHTLLSIIKVFPKSHWHNLKTWKDWLNLFRKQTGIFDRPLILIIDEFDKLPNQIIENLVSLFREMYLNRNHYVLHSLALVGVRAVLGVESKSGSPFNIQRSLHIPNLSFDEVQRMFNQYQEESKQAIEPVVIQKLYEKTQGQPGLIGWFGELLTQKYNENLDKPIDIKMWNRVYLCASEIEYNNTVQNIITKAINEYKSYAIQLFTDSNIHFSFRYNWCNYMYMHGMIGYDMVQDNNQMHHVCRFSSPFIQVCLYSAFVGEIKESQEHTILPLDPLDTLDDIIDYPTLNTKALLERYKNYLNRLKENGINPWQNQPRRKKDHHLTEAVGHFHLYHWLKMALGIQSSIIPEFPTGNGKVDLHIEYQGKKGIIEIKSFTNANDAMLARTQSANYAKQTGYPDVTLAMFAPFTDIDTLNQLTVHDNIDGIDVNVVAIGQG